jgi:CPA1 family monovalent cation:H+ antiporter
MDLLHAILLFFLGAAAISLLAERLHLPYTIALLIAGLAMGRWHLVRPVTVTPEVLFIALILPLLFDGGLHLPITDLVRYGRFIGLLAVVGSLAAAAIIGGAAALLWHVPVRAAFLLGAIASAIDPVSVIALVREANLDRRLGTILEGEAVFNDAVAIVLFTLAAAPRTPGILLAAGQFVWLLGAGAIIGLGLGLAVTASLGRVRQHLVEMLGSLVLAIAAFLAADSVGGSGVIAVVAAGVVLGNAAPRVLTATGQQTLRTVWEAITFLANSALFLLIGLTIPWQPLRDLAGLILVVVLAALAARAAVVYGFAVVSGRGPARVPRIWQHILVWGGLRGGVHVAARRLLRGGVAIALVLGLPAALPGRHEVATAVYGLVIFTLLGQGLSMPVLVRRAGNVE